MATADETEVDVIEWLSAADPAVRWQVMRDLQGKSRPAWRAEQARVAAEGWGRRLLDLRDPAGTWGGGIYTPKWTSTTYTLLLLADLGLPHGTPAAVEGTRLIYEAQISPWRNLTTARRLKTLDQCLLGMDLRLACCFGLRDERVELVLSQIFAEQMPDGGWNCARKRRPSNHASVHTTINILEGLAEYVNHRAGPRTAEALKSMERAEEFLLVHRLYKSHRTGKVMREEFTKFSFPPRWHYDVLRSLDYFARYDRPRDARHADAVKVVESKRQPDGRWPLQNHHRGLEPFKLERQGKPSRWNTLRALRVLKWWRASQVTNRRTQEGAACDG